MERKNSHRKGIRIAGFGGQGVVLAGQILGQAASIYDHGYATLSQSYGPEARGGSCAAEVVVSGEPVGYPYVVDPEVVVILSQEAYTKYAADLPKGVMLITDSDLVKLESGNGRKPLSIPASRMAREMGRPVVANIIMLGFITAVTGLVSKDAAQKSIMATVPAGTGEFNLKAFEMGYNYGLEHGK